MEKFLQLKILELCNKAEHCFGIYWEEWRAPVRDLVLVSKAMDIDSEELNQAHDKAIEAIQNLKTATQATLTKVKQRIVHTCLEPQVPLHVDNETTRVEPGHPANALDVVCDQVELPAGICVQPKS